MYGYTARRAPINVVVQVHRIIRDRAGAGKVHVCRPAPPSAHVTTAPCAMSFARCELDGDSLEYPPMAVRRCQHRRVARLAHAFGGHGSRSRITVKVKVRSVRIAVTVTDESEASTAIADNRQTFEQSQYRRSIITSYQAAEIVYQWGRRAVGCSLSNGECCSQDYYSKAAAS